ncbi:MAG: bifunctional metallophosphatase/5'-nucleotidase, partial [Pseudomonadales bacterium]|nr:bifunctional metallophosphatase/5'-nucleotidase [Pseudomonadales bacterium]
MKNRFAHLILLLLLPFWALAAEKDLVIIHTNDFHGHIQHENEYAGAARIAAFVKQVRATNDGVLVLDAGDAISGTPVSTMFKGAPIFEVLNLVGYDAGAIGNHEFDHGYERIEKFREIANYPLLSANAFGPTGDLLADAPMLIKQVNGIRVGIIGLITDYTPNMITPTGNEGISFAPPMYTLAATVRAIRPHVDLLIALSHVGHEEEKQLARTVPGIDIIVGGHSHTKVDPPAHVGDTWVVQADHYGKYVGELNVTVDTDAHRMTAFKGKLVAAADLPPPDPAVQKVVDEWEAKVASIVDVKIASTNHTWTQVEMQPVLEGILAEATDTAFGFYNMGGIRDVFREGAITARDVWNIEPFGNSLVTVTTDGATLKKIFMMDGERHPGLADLRNDDMYTFGTN